MIIPKRQIMVVGLENVIITLYAKGMTVSDGYAYIQETFSASWEKNMLRQDYIY
jgi:putative transposase